MKKKNYKKMRTITSIIFAIIVIAITLSVVIYRWLPTLTGAKEKEHLENKHLKVDPGKLLNLKALNNIQEDKSAKQQVITVDEKYEDNPVVKGANWCLNKKFNYDFDMAYRLTVYDKEGKIHKKPIYPWGDIDPNIGVCTDVVVRAYRQLGIDLQQLLHEDAVKNKNAYPYSRWGNQAPDTNIDHRRVPMLEVFFKRHAKSLTTKATSDTWKPGDIVIWDMNNDNWSDHIGIISNKKMNDKYLVIHNFPSPGYVAEEDVLYQWKIAGHYRYLPE